MQYNDLNNAKGFKTAQTVFKKSFDMTKVLNFFV